MNGKSRRGKKSSLSFWKLMHGGVEDPAVSRPIAWVSPSSLGAEESPEGAMHGSPQIIPQAHRVWLVWDEDRLQQHGRGWRLSWQ